MKHKLHRQIYPALFLLAVLMSCSGPEKLIQKGRYEQALNTLVQRLERGKITAEKIAWLQEAYDHQEPIWVRRIEPFLTTTANSSQLQGALSELNLVIRQQDQMEQIKDRIESAGFSVSTLSMDTLLNWKDRITDRLIHAYKNETDTLMVLARGGDKLAARQAYSLYQRWLKLAPDQNRLQSAMEESQSLGTNHVLFIVVDQRHDQRTNLSANGQEYEPGRIIDDWTVLHFQDEPMPFDFILYLDVNQLAVSPERVTEKQHYAQKRVIDGYRVRRDTAGNAVFDSLGKVVKDPVWITASARMVEVIKSREASLLGNLELRDEANGAIVWSHPVDLFQRFNNQFARYQGDPRALTNEERRLADNVELPFPETTELQAILWDELMNRIAEEVANLPVKAVSI